jgi:hypothetical protein
LNFELILGGPRYGVGSSFKKGIGVSSVPTRSSKIQNFVETNLDQNYEIIFWVKVKT